MYGAFAPYRCDRRQSSDDKILRPSKFCLKPLSERARYTLPQQCNWLMPLWVMWRPGFFGVKPELVIKGGFIAWSPMGESNASLMTCEPILYRPQWGSFGQACQKTSYCFVTQAALDKGLLDRLGLKKQLLPVKGTRSLTKADMLHNNVCPNIEVDPDTFQVRVDGELATCDPVSQVPLGRLYIFR